VDTIHETLMDLTVVDGQIMRHDGRPFDRVDYSHFKYGYVPPAVEYGKELAHLIADRLFTLAGTTPITIVAAPYKFLRTASEQIAIALRDELVIDAQRRGIIPPKLVPLYKAAVGDSSYAKSSMSDRLSMLATLGLSTDESRITGHHVLVVDDIRITGTAEKVTAKYLEPLNPASVWYLHAARLDEGIGVEYPHLEDEMNQSAVHSLEVILEQVEARQFALNTRVLRFILETKGSEKLLAFTDAAPRSLLEEIQQSAVGNGPEYCERYRTTLQLITHQLQAQNPLTISGN